ARRRPSPKPDDGPPARRARPRRGHRPLRPPHLRHDRPPLRRPRRVGGAAGQGQGHRRGEGQVPGDAGRGAQLQPARPGQDHGVAGPAGLPDLPQPRRPRRLQPLPRVDHPRGRPRRHRGVPGAEVRRDGGV
ncbi:MAG: hypothetical protein AVDCRST_MAG73-833, partial [uncultured Thermomicrobiales bacterium]